MGAQGKGSQLWEQFPSKVDVITWCKRMLGMGCPGLLSFHPATSQLPFSLPVQSTFTKRLNLQWTRTHLNPFIAKLLFNNYITVLTVLHNEISMRDIRKNIKL